jgi:tetratricopeptide (TPR) repeat protein
MRSILLITIGFLVTDSLHGQGYFEKFKKHSAAKDTAAQWALLQEWSKKDNNDPELYTSYFNYYVQKSMSEVIRLDRQSGPGKNFQIKDSADQVVGYIHGETSYNPKYLNLGFAAIDNGISKFPDRLDMRFGKTYMLGQVNNYGAFTDEIVHAIDHSVKIKNNWQWTMNESVNDPKDFFLNNLQHYINYLFNLGDGQASNIRRIAETTLRNYPDHIISLSNLGISYILENNYEKALEPLLTAEKKTPQDAIILGNIAYAYLNLKDNKNAILYYEKVIQFGDHNNKRFAEEQLKKLRLD